MKISRRNLIIGGGITAASLLLGGCSTNSRGVTGGAVNGFVHRGIYESCNKNGNADSEGKVIKLLNQELKLPVDWGYVHRNQADFDGGNWQGEDDVRGIGIFNCNEEGDGSEFYRRAYALNVRWEYCRYGYKEGVFPAHAHYKAKHEGTGIEVGGTSASCVYKNKIINCQIVDGKQISALKSAHIIVYNPESKLACVCGTGFNAVPELPSTDLNWGGAPLALLGGITEAVSSCIEAKQNKSVLELYFTSPDTPLGPCEFGSPIKKKNKGCTENSFIDASSAVNLAVSVAFDPHNPNYNGHTAVNVVSGSNGRSVCPTTQAAQVLRNAVAGDNSSADCGYFLASVIIATMDKDFPKGSTSVQASYMNESPKWQKIMSNTPSGSSIDESMLQPGDVFNDPSRHTFMYVGSQAIKEQFSYASSSYNCVGASQDSHGPTIQTLSSQRSGYNVYRCVNKDPNKSILNKL